MKTFYRLMSLVVVAALVFGGYVSVQAAPSSGLSTNNYVNLIHFYKPPENADSTTLVQNMSTIILTFGDESFRDSLISQGYPYTILEYLRFDAIMDPGDCTSTPWHNQVAYKPGDFCDISQNHPDWFLLDANGNRITLDVNFYLMDPANTGWQSFWITRALEIQNQNGWKGVFLDNAEASLHKRYQENGVPVKYPDDASYTAAVESFLRFLHVNYAQATGRPMLANIVAIQDTSMWFQYLQYLDGAMYEGWSMDWASGYYSADTWNSELEMIEQTQALGKYAILVPQGTQSDTARQAFTFASYLLITEGRATFRYADAGNYNQVWLYNDYNVNLGSPLGPRYQVGSVWRRDFTNGYVEVDPGRHTANISTGSSPTPVPTLVFPTATNVPAGVSGVVDRIRFYPRSTHPQRMVGGTFQGSNVSPTEGFVTLATITSQPTSDAWTELTLNNTTPYRYLRYMAPDNGYGNVAEVEFYSGNTRLRGGCYGTPGSWADSGATHDKAMDGDVTTFFDAPTADGDYVGIDTGETSPVNTPVPTTVPPTATFTSIPPTPTLVQPTATSIPATPTQMLPTATVVPPTATQVPVTVSGAVNRVRFFPRTTHPHRMTGGVFQGSNVSPTEGFVNLVTITNQPSEDSWTELTFNNNTVYRYLRYLSPDNGYGNVAEIEFYSGNTRLQGAGFGTPGSWANSGNTFDKALDGNINTYFDAASGDENYVGIDTGATSPVNTPAPTTVPPTATFTSIPPTAPPVQPTATAIPPTATQVQPTAVPPTATEVPVSADNVVNRVRFYPRTTHPQRMVGGIFQGSNVSPTEGFVNLVTVTSEPPRKSWTELSFDNNTSYRYLRYLSPDGGFGSVAEIQFYAGDTRLQGAGFGTPGSWDNSGNTYDKALDGNTNTYFDAPTGDGNYVGIDIGQ